MKSSNIALKKVPQGRIEESVSIQGVINKTIMMFSIMFLGGWAIHSFLGSESSLSGGVMIGTLVVNFIVALVYIFNPKLNFLAPIYAITEGALLYVISNSYELQYPGIVFTAVTATLTVFAVMLFLYKSRIIQATAGFKKFMMVALVSIFVFYIVTFILSLTGFDISYFTGSGNLSIGISLAIVAIASLTLILDFNRIEESVGSVDKKYEWYLSFGLIISLVWLYLEILRLIAKSRK